MTAGYVLLAGVGPVPPEEPPLQMAPGLRLWSMVLSLLDLGLDLRVISCDHFGHRPPGLAGSLWPLPQLEVRLLPGTPNPEHLASAWADGPPLAAVTTTDGVGAAVARALPPEVPLWADLYGDPVAEGELLAAGHVHDGGLGPLAANMLAILLRADRFSACSRAHRLAMLGQLGLAGRFNAANCRSDLVAVLPAMLVDPSARPAGDPVMRGPLIGAEDIAVLWSGGFNTWTDVATLADGLNRAMTAEPRLRFICLGGAIDRHSPGTYGEFVRLVEASPNRGRFHLLGWRPQGEVPAFIAEADLGINIDAACHEAELGTRTRLLEWADAGLAICSTPNTEMAQDLAAAGGLEPFLGGHPERLGQALIALARDPEHRAAVGQRARDLVHGRWTPATAGKVLAEWIRNPQRAPDQQPGAPAAGTNHLGAWMRALEPALRSDQAPPADLAGQISRLRSLEGSRLVRLRDRLRRGR